MTAPLQAMVDSLAERLEGYDQLTDALIKIAEATGADFNGAPPRSPQSLILVAEATAERIEELREQAAQLPTHSDGDYRCPCGQQAIMLPHINCSFDLPQEPPSVVHRPPIAAEGSLASASK